MIQNLAVAWYPEQCDESRWPQDIAQMKSAGIDTVRVLEFAWSRIERDDSQWDFAWVHRFMRLLDEAPIKVVLCTPSAAPPRWLTRQHPECLQVRANGDVVQPGARRHYCPTSGVYRLHANRIAARMQHELGGYANVIAWQIDNELGFNRCYCPACETAFRESLKRQYGTLENLNAAWGGAFWSTDAWDWRDVTLPRNSPAPEVRQAFEQFYSDSIIDFMNQQVRALREAGCAVPISTNMMADFTEIDYWKAAQQLDFIGWDNYFDQFTLPGNSLAHNLMRGLKEGKGYWTFENGVNSVSPWLQSAPGFMKIHALSGAAHGEIGHTLFRFDSCPFGHEQDLQGLVDWAGRPRAKMAEIAELSQTLAGWRKEGLPPLEPKVAIIFSWQNYWATRAYYGNSIYSEPYGSYWNEVERYYTALFDLGIPCDCIHPDADLSSYDLVIAPGMCLVTDEQIKAIAAYVRDGGVLLSGRKSFAKHMTGSYRRSDHPTDLIDVFGMRVAETQSNEDGNDLHTRSAAQRRPFRQFHLAPAAGGQLPPTPTHGWFEVLELHGATALYEYTDGYFPNRPAATGHHCGAGEAFYLGTAIDRPAMRELMRICLKSAGIDRMIEVPDGASVIQRGRMIVALNHSSKAVEITIPPAVADHEGDGSIDGNRLTLPPYAWAKLQVDTATWPGQQQCCKSAATAAV